MSEQPTSEQRFYFAFPEGGKWSDEMDRKELLQVIQCLLAERNLARETIRDISKWS